jgi:hypothetical protein
LTDLPLSTIHSMSDHLFGFYVLYIRNKKLWDELWFGA